MSYTQSDRHWAEWVVWVLEQSGYACFAQFANIPPGSDFIHQMNIGLSNSKQVVPILSPAYLRSDFARSELYAAIGSDPIGTKRRLVPIRVKDCIPQGMLATRVYIDLVGKDAPNAVDLLIKGIEASRIARPASDSSFSFETPPKFPGQGSEVTRGSDGTHAAAARVGPTKILLIASQRGTGLELSRQVRSIQRGMKDALGSGEVSFDARYDVLAEDIADVINEVAPHIVHFSGKQNGQRILVPTASGGVTTVAAKALTGLFLNLAATVRLVIVDTCRSLPSARELCTTVDFAIGVESDVYDDDATYFYTQLYSALTRGLSLKKAVGQARASLALKKVAKDEIPVLLCHEGADPGAFHVTRVDK